MLANCMKLPLAFCFTIAAFAQPPNPDAFYKLGPDSLPQDGVPKGEIRGPFKIDSKAYPGTFHTYWIYVPAQYDASIPASLMIFNDGQAYMAPAGDVRAQNVMDNLIYRREIPVMIGVFINPGHTPEQPEPTPAEWGDRTTNRPTEYNSLDDRYPRRITTSRRIPIGTASAGRALARSRRLPSPGSGPTISGKSSASSAAS
jgi:hypothetical protein